MSFTQDNWLFFPKNCHRFNRKPQWVLYATGRTIDDKTYPDISARLGQVQSRKDERFDWRILRKPFTQGVALTLLEAKTNIENIFSAKKDKE